MGCEEGLYQLGTRVGGELGGRVGPEGRLVG